MAIAMVCEKKLCWFFLEDLKIRKFIKKSFHHAGISRVEIEPRNERIRLTCIQLVRMTQSDAEEWKLTN